MRSDVTTEEARIRNASEKGRQTPRIHGSWTVARSDSPGRPHDAAPATAAQNAQIAPPARAPINAHTGWPITREKPPSSVDPRQSASAGRVLGRTVPVWAVSSTPPAPSTALRDMNSRDRLRISDPSTSPRCEAAAQTPGGGITRAPYPDILVQVARSRTPSSPSSTPPHLRRVLLVTTTLEHFHGGLSNGLATEATPESARCIALARLRHRALWWPASRAPCGFGPSATIRRPFPPARARTSARDRPGSASLKHSSCPRPSLPYFQAPPRSCARYLLHEIMPPSAPRPPALRPPSTAYMSPTRSSCFDPVPA